MSATLCPHFSLGCASVVDCLYATEKLATLLADSESDESPEIRRLAVETLMEVCSHHRFANRRFWAFVDDDEDTRRGAMSAGNLVRLIRSTYPELNALRDLVAGGGEGKE